MSIFIAKALLKLHVHSFRICFTRKYGNYWFVNLFSSINEKGKQNIS